MSDITKIKVKGVSYDIGADYSNIENTPDLTQKQDALVSGVNIKTVNNESLLGSGNIVISGGGSDLPSVTVDDNGEVLTVVDGEWAASDIPTELPTVSNIDNGKVLTVVDGEWNKANAPSSSDLPDVTQEDDGKILRVVEGEWAISSESSGGLSNDVKDALLNMFQVVAYTSSDAQTYYDALEDALYPPVPVVSIEATFNQGQNVVYDDDSLTTLKQYLTVIGTQADSETIVIENYTLSGTLTVGTSTITVVYEGKTTTFIVNVSASPTISSISATYTQSGTVYESDSLNSLKSDLVVTARYADSSTSVVSDYVLSGTLVEGTSTITVTYQGKTTTFTVTVSGSGNIFDPTTATVASIYTKNATLGSPILGSSSNPSYATAWCEIEGGKTYKITKDLSNSFRIGTTAVVPGNNVVVLQTDADHSGTEMTITTNTDAHYLYFTYWYSGNASYPSEEPIRNSIVVEEV